MESLDILTGFEGILEHFGTVFKLLFALHPLSFSPSVYSLVLDSFFWLVLFQGSFHIFSKVLNPRLSSLSIV